MSNPQPTKLNVLEKTASAQILLYLFIKNKPVNRQEIANNVKAASDTLDSTLEYLKINNLITEEKVRKFRQERIFTLTDLGLKVAQPLTLIVDALQSATAVIDTSKQKAQE